MLLDYVYWLQGSVVALVHSDIFADRAWILLLEYEASRILQLSALSTGASRSVTGQV